MTEQWKDIIYPLDLNGLYLISDAGNVYSCQRERFVKQWLSRKNGYLKVRLGQKKYTVSVLVALHFVDNPNPLIYTEVNHKDGNKYNNEANNLEWVTSKQNKIHAAINNLNPAAKLTSEQVIEIKRMIEDKPKTGVTNREIAEIFGVSKRSIDNISCGVRWSYLN